MNTEELYSYYRNYPVISTDTRSISEGCLFFALRGESFDGNRFAAEALQKGAAYAIIDHPDYQDGKRTILVDNVLESLQQLALHHRRQFHGPVIGITGSNGKTTTKELIAAVLQQNYKVTYTRGNLNNHIGVPLSLLAIDDRTEIAIIEMGANHPGEIDFLCRIAEPDYGIITNIGKAHLEGFGSFEGVIRTKSELYNFLRAHQGKCFINTDNPLLRKQASGLEWLSYGTGEHAQLRGQTEKGDYFVTARVLFPKGWLYLKSHLIGQYNFENIMAAARAGMQFSVDPLQIQQAILTYQPGNNRSQLIEKRSNKIIMDAYNANPTSMQAALTNFRQISHSPKSLFLGDMLELGDYSSREHQKIADMIDPQEFDQVCLIGDHFSQVATRAGNISKLKNTEELIRLLKNRPPQENQLILIKGSHGIHLEKMIDFI